MILQTIFITAIAAILAAGQLQLTDKQRYWLDKNARDHGFESIEAAEQASDRHDYNSLWEWLSMQPYPTPQKTHAAHGYPAGVLQAAAAMTQHLKAREDALDMGADYSDLPPIPENASMTIGYRVDNPAPPADVKRWIMLGGKWRKTIGGVPPEWAPMFKGHYYEQGFEPTSVPPAEPHIQKRLDRYYAAKAEGATHEEARKIAYEGEQPC